MVYWVHKPGVPHGPASQQRLGLTDNVASNAQLMGRPKHLNDRPEGQSNLRPEGLVEEERRPLPTPAHLFDRSARFGLQPASGQTLRPEGLAKHHFRLRPVSPTGDTSNPSLQLFFDRRNQRRLGPADWGRPLGKDQKTYGESKAAHSSQPQYQGPYPVHLLDSTLRPP